MGRGAGTRAARPGVAAEGDRMGPCAGHGPMVKKSKQHMTFRKLILTLEAAAPGGPARDDPASGDPTPGDPASDDCGAFDHLVLYFDFVDPVSCLISRMMDRAGTGANVEWRGFELRPPPQPVIDARSTEWEARHAVAVGHGKRSGDDGPASPPFIPWTRKAHELCELARERDCLHAVRAALFQAHFIDHTDIGRIDLLVETARTAGLDPTEARAVLDVDRYTATVLRTREAAIAEGIADVPALVHPGGRLEGAEVLREIERAIGAAGAAERGAERQQSREE